jgi:hypothetical protein
MKPLRLLALTLTCASLPSFAQQVISAKSGLLSYVEGNVTLNGEPADFSGVHFSDVKENSVVRTADGRAEVLLTPGVVLRMGENTSLRMISNRLVDTRLELLTGSAVVEADQIAKDTSVTIVCKDGVVTLPKAGLYRFDTEPAQIKVFKGDADVELGGASQVVSGGHLLALSNGSTATVAKFDVEDTDSLDRWSHRRGSYLAMANASAANSLVSSGGGSGIYGLGGYGLRGYGLAGWGLAGCSSAWAYNMYYNMMTYMPCYGSLWSPYGYRFWSPYTIYRYNGFAPPIYGGGAGRTGTSSSGSASLARPVATASNRANSPAPSLGTSRGAFSSGAGAGRVGGTTSAISNASSGGFAGGGGGFSGGGGGFSGGGHAGGAGASAGGGGGGGGHAGGGGRK